MFTDISKHSLVFVVIRKHDQVCDKISLVPRAKSEQRALLSLSQRAPSATGRNSFLCRRKTAKAFRGFSKHSLVFLRNGIGNRDKMCVTECSSKNEYQLIDPNHGDHGKDGGNHVERVG